MFLWVLFWHNYIIPQKRLHHCFFRDAAFSFVFLQRLFIQSRLWRPVKVDRVRTCRVFGDYKLEFSGVVLITASAIGFRFLLLTKGSGSVRAKPSHFARQREYSARSAATLRAGVQSKRPKSAKGVWGKTRVFPHKQHIVFVEPILRNSPVDCFGSTLHS